jgi:LmbE family N-acetylglucosaminyl deacetylase
MGEAGDWLANLAAAVAGGRKIAGRTAVVVAHPDDETLWIGGCLPAFEDLLLVHLTDGAPQDMYDARRAGCMNREDYARTRAAELDAALAKLGVSPQRRSYGFGDQQTVFDLPQVVDRLADDLVGCEAVITHAYDGGHPDHDSAAFACARIEGPLRLEFAGYHRRDGRRVCGDFWGQGEDGRIVIDLPNEAWRRKQAAAAAHASQWPVIAGLVSRTEILHPAPAYDFSRPPPPGACLYDGFGWSLTGALWRDRAQEAIGAWA